MRLSVGEIGKLTGVSARTLHYYDEIGLLRPSETAESGYRYYDGPAVERLQQILFFRELDFPLADIARILSDPGFDRANAMREHRTLLVARRDRLNELIRLTEQIAWEENDMKAFDKSDIEATEAKYAAEAEARWGKTEAYKESKKRTKGYSSEEWANIQSEMDDLVRAFSGKLDADPASAEVQALVKRWQDHITKYYYVCTNEILAGLGQMYVGDERFTANLDRFADGTAGLMAEAIRVYTAK